MANYNPIVTSLKGYVDNETNKNQIIAKSVLGAKTATLLTLQTGVKGKTKINLLDTDVVFGDGTTCGFESAGSATVSQREIDPAVLKVNMEFCAREFLGTFKQYEVKLSAGYLDQEIPFEEYFLNHITDKVKYAVEEMIWQGDSSQATPQFDGLLKILAADGALTATKGATINESILNTYAKLPEEAHADDTVIFVAAPLFRAWVQELVANNMFHYNPNDTEGQYTLPGTNVKVISVNGLKTTGVDIVAGRLSNMFYGTDLDNSEEDVAVVYDERTETMLVKILFSAGVQVAYPEFIVTCAH